MELANTLVVLVGAPRATFEDLFGEDCAMFCFTVSSVREVANDVSKLNVCARVQEICQGVRCLVWRGGVYPVFFYGSVECAGCHLPCSLGTCV